MEQKVAVVTGAARGIGRAYALRLAAMGFDVAVLDRDLDAAAEFGETLEAGSVAEEVGLLGRRGLGIEADLLDHRQLTGAVEAVVESFGRIDLLVNNAGGAFAPIERSWASRFTREDYDAMLDLNLRSTVEMCQAVVPHMLRDGGVIVNIASMAALIPAVRGGRLAHYGSAKSAVVTYTRFLAAELGPFGIRVNAIAPGTIATSRNRAQAAQRDIGTSGDLDRIPLRRLGTEADCAGTLEFLASDLSGYVTGQCISVCGGRVLTPS